MKDFQKQPPNPKARKILDGLKKIQDGRLNHDIAVRECAHFVIPRKSDTRDINTISSYNGGELKAYANLFTRAGRSACQKMASGIFSYMTPKNQKWFKIITGNKKVDENEKVYEYFDTVRDVMLDFISRSNFTEISHETYLNLGAIGTACTTVEWDSENSGLIFTDFPYNTFWFSEDNHGRVNRVYRQFKWTAEQAVDEWGEKALEKCASVMKAYYSENEDERVEQFTFVHLVEPNKHRKHGKIDNASKKYRSVYLCEEDKQIISESGFDVIPYKIARFLKYNTEGNVMGYSPAMDCMPIIKSLEQLKKKFILAVEKNLNPAMSRGVTMGLTPQKIRTAPNAVNNFDSRNPESKPAPILQQIDLSYSLQELEEEVKQIEDAFFIPSFQAITNIDKSNATATEIIAREREALIAINPSISRIENEWLEYILQEVFDTLQAQGRFPEPPPELEDEVRLKLEFTGLLSSAPKLIESVSAMNFFQEFGMLLEFMPDDERAKAMNGIKYDEVIKTLMDNRNLPPRFRKSKQEMEEEAQKDQAQQQAMMEQQQMLELAKSQNLNEAPQDGSVAQGMQ